MCRPLRERARPVTYREPTENEIFRNAAGAAVAAAAPASRSRAGGTGSSVPAGSRSAPQIDSALMSRVIRALEERHMTQGHLCSLLGMNAGRFSTLKGGRRVPDAMATEYAALLSSWLDDPDFRVCDAREPLQKRPRQATAGAGSSSDGAAEEAPPKRARPAGESPPCGPAEAEPRARRSATKARETAHEEGGGWSEGRALGAAPPAAARLGSLSLWPRGQLSPPGRRRIGGRLALGAARAGGPRGAAAGAAGARPRLAPPARAVSRKERRGEHLPDRERGGERGRL